MKFDLHLHSYYSDGALSPAQVARLAHEAGCDCVALTDHDTMSGVEEMDEACLQYGMRNLHGIEISTFDGVEVHLLAFNFDIQNRAFQDFLETLKDKREERAYKTLEKLRQHRIEIDIAQLKKIARNGISRSHIAAAMVQQGIEKDYKAAFDKWLTESASCYVPLYACTPEECIKRILEASGVPVLAHPCRLRLDKSQRANLVGRLASCGLMGLEVKYRNASKENVSFFSKLCDQYRLIKTCGSDFHNPEGYVIMPKLLDAHTKSVLLK